MIRIFISHSSKDKDIAGSIADLLVTCLGVNNKDIRCTSVPGYKLEIGQHVSAQLAKEIEECQVLIGLLTNNSQESMFVAFELGAAWGLKKTTLPIVSPTISLREWKSPISELHHMKLHDKPDWLQLVETVAKKLDIPYRDPSFCDRHIERMITSFPVHSLT